MIIQFCFWLEVMSIPTAHWNFCHLHISHNILFYKYFILGEVVKLSPEMMTMSMDGLVIYFAIIAWPGLVHELFSK